MPSAFEEDEMPRVYLFCQGTRILSYFCFVCFNGIWDQLLMNTLCSYCCIKSNYTSAEFFYSLFSYRPTPNVFPSSFYYYSIHHFFAMSFSQ